MTRRITFGRGYCNKFEDHLEIFDTSSPVFGNIWIKTPDAGILGCLYIWSLLKRFVVLWLRKTFWAEWRFLQEDGDSIRISRVGLIGGYCVFLEGWLHISLGQRSVDAIFTCVDLNDIVLVSRSNNMLSVTDFVPKGIISGVRVQAGLHLDMLDADRSPNMQSAFLPELHRWISKLTARRLHACPPGDLLITMVKETVILYKKEFRKMKKSRISPWSERDENAKWLRDCLWLCQACKCGLHVGLCEEIFARKHTATHKPTSAQPLSAPHSDQRDI